MINSSCWYMELSVIFQYISYFMAQYIKRYNTFEHYTLSASITTPGVLICENEHVTDRYRGKNSVTIGGNPTEKIYLCQNRHVFSKKWRVMDRWFLRQGLLTPRGYMEHCTKEGANAGEQNFSHVGMSSTAQHGTLAMLLLHFRITTFAMREMVSGCRIRDFFDHYAFLGY